MRRGEGGPVPLTLVGGRIVYRDGVLRSMDEGELRARVHAEAQALHRQAAPKQRRDLRTLRAHLAAPYRDMTVGQRLRR